MDLARASVAESGRRPPQAPMHLFLLVGQSNMAGRGRIGEVDRKPHPRVMALDAKGVWVPAVDPIHFDKPIAGVGLGKTFGEVIADANPGVTVGLIPCAVGGSPIDAWRQGEFYEPTKSHPWDDAMKRARIALKSGELKGILWHQGESDATSELSEGYEAKLHDLVRRFREELAAPRVPFVAGQMGRFEGSPWDAARERVDKAHRDLPERVAMTAFVPSTGLGHNGDGIHFDAAAYRELGRWFAAAYLKLAAEAPGALVPGATAP
ncbi:MAG: sialate O-acetylesterase [Limisphaerales bacterium]